MGDGGHHGRGSVKLPDSLRYSPPQLAKYKSQVDPYDSHHDKDQNHGYHNGNSNNNNNDYYHHDNGHIPIAHPAAGQHHRRDASPPIHPAAPHKRDLEHHRSSTKLSNGANHHHRSSILSTPPPRGANDHHKVGSQHPRAYDDYELERRRQQMERPRDTKDYLIGGPHGPHPKNKLHNEQQQHHGNNNHYDEYGRESQPHWNSKLPGKFQPPSHAANRAEARKHKPTEREPYRSRSYPREGKSLVKNEQRKQNIGAGAGAHSMVDLKGHPMQPAPQSRHHQSRAGHNSLIDEDDDDYVYDPHEKPKYGPRRAPGKAIGSIVNSELNNDPNKAKVVMFFKNGDSFFPGVKVSFKAKDFISFEALCAHLTPRTDLPNGVRYIFNMDGEKIKGLNEFEEGGSYICSSKKKFVPLPYSPGKPGWNPHSKFKMQEDLKLFRPPSPGAAAGNSSDGQQPSKGKKFIRVINNDHQRLQIRHMLNSRTTQPWENMIQGMAETLRMPNGKKLFSYTGRQIQSYSQLRNELRDGDIFYLCSGDSFGPTIPRHAETSRSLDEPDRHPKGHRKSNRPGSAPDWHR